MHTLLKVTMDDVRMANDAINEGRLAHIMKQVSDLIKPESTFFYSDHGYRAAMFIFDLKDVSLIPTIAEPLFTQLNAKVEFIPGMDTAELSKGLDSIQKQRSNISLS